MLDADFPLEVVLPDVKSQVFFLALPGILEGGCCPEGGIKGNVRVVAPGRPGLNVAAPLLLGPGL